MPKIIIGHGQGALVALGVGMPFVMALSLQTISVQRPEAQKIGEAWGAISAIIGVNPRLFRKGLMLDILQPVRVLL